VGLMLTILMLFIILILAALLITAYVITPIIGWLMMNPLGGVALFVVIVVLASILLIEEIREGKRD
jgi:hypothetical protein